MNASVFTWEYPGISFQDLLPFVVNICSAYKLTQFHVCIYECNICLQEMATATQQALSPKSLVWGFCVHSCTIYHLRSSMNSCYWGNPIGQGFTLLWSGWRMTFSWSIPYNHIVLFIIPFSWSIPYNRTFWRWFQFGNLAIVHLTTKLDFSLVYMHNTLCV